jgi:twinkle protein
MVQKALNNNIWFVKPEKDFTLDSILSSVLQLISRKGIKFFVIDAWNKLEHLDDSTGYVGKQLDKLANFCELHQVHCFLVAHPRKMEKDNGIYRVPTLYDVAGSSNFYNKTDNGLCVYRDFDKKTTTIYRQKIKFNHWGTDGMSEYNYDLDSTRYYKDFLDNTNWITGFQQQETMEFKPLVENKSFLNDNENVYF